MNDDVIDGTAVEVESPSAVAVYVEPPRGLSVAVEPGDVIELATKMANALKDIVEKQKLYANISGKKYPQVEAWLTVARLDNVVAREHGLPVRHEDGSYEAVVDLIRLSDGMVVGQGSAICGTEDDPPWHTRSATAKRGMAVTRATSRACRQHYAWVMAIAGYQPTPAEEMTGDEAPRPSNPARPASQQGGAVRNVTPEQNEAPGASEAGTVQVVVSEQPEDAVRMVRDGHTPPRWADARPKLEIVGKVGNRKHTAMVMGPLAEAAAVAGIKVGDVVQFVDASVEEITWSTDPSKPKRKEVWGTVDYQFSDVQVGRDGAWISVSSPSSGASSSPAPSPSAEPGAPTPSAPPSSPTTPTTTASETRKAGEPGSWATIKARVDGIEYMTRGEAEVLILRTAEVETGELVIAALANDIEEQVGPKGELTVGTVVAMYGEWKSGGRFIIDTIGKAA